MKLLLSVFILVMITSGNFYYGQKTIHFIDDDGNTIPYVYIKSLDSTFRVHSNEEGKYTFDINKKQPTYCIAEKYGFTSLPFLFDTIKQYNEIKMSEIVEIQNLKEVIVNGAKIKLKEIKLNQFDEIQKGVIGFQVNSLKGLKFFQYVNKSDFSAEGKLLALSINASSFPGILNIRFFSKSSEGLPDSCINNEVIVFPIIETGWITLDISKYNLRIPKGGVFIEYELFSKPNQVGELFLNGLLSGYKIDKENYYPIYRQDTITKQLIPLKYLDGNYSPNLAFNLDVRVKKSVAESIKKAMKFKEIKDKKKTKVLKKLNLNAPSLEKNKYPNSTIEELLNSSIKLIKENNLPYFLFHLYLADKKEQIIDTYERCSKPDWDKDFSIKIYTEALKSIQKGNGILIEDGCYYILTEFDHLDKSYKIRFRLFETNEGWKIDERNITK